MSGRGGLGGEPSNSSATGGCLYFLHACDAMQLPLVSLFHAKLANVLRAAVIAIVITLFKLFFFFLIDASDVAHHVAGQMTIGVVSEKACFNFNTRKSKVLRCKFGNLFVSQSRTNGQRVKVF